MPLHPFERHSGAHLDGPICQCVASIGRDRIFRKMLGFAWVSYKECGTASLRADRLLVERGLFSSRAKAQAAIAAGLVTANAALVRKASDEIPVDADLRASAEHPWVSRAGVKLAAALDHFRIDPRERVCLDVGASTGGFTDVLLSRGARLVYAIDVGRDQLDARLRRRPEVISLEQADIRTLDPRRLPESPDLDGR